MEQVEKTQRRVGTIRGWGTRQPDHRPRHGPRQTGDRPRADRGRRLRLLHRPAAEKRLLRRARRRGEAAGPHGLRHAPDAGRAPRLHRLPREPRSPADAAVCQATRRWRCAATRPLPEQPDWGTGGIIDFPRVVQPVLDKYCVECHSGPTPAGAVDLTRRQDPFLQHGLRQPDRPRPGRLLPDARSRDHRSHDAAVGRFAVEPACAGTSRPTSTTGRRCRLADRQRIYAWIDANVPYYGTYEHQPAWRPTAGSRDGWDLENPHGWFRQDCSRCSTAAAWIAIGGRFSARRRTAPGRWR